MPFAPSSLITSYAMKKNHLPDRDRRMADRLVPVRLGLHAWLLGRCLLDR